MNNNTSANPEIDTTTPPRLLIQAIAYEHVDHLFGDTKPCNVYPLRDIDDLITSIPSAPSHDFQYMCWKAQFVEPVFNMFGTTDKGESVQIAVRGFRPTLKFLIEDATMNLETARHQVSRFCQAVFSKNKFKEVNQAHVLIGESKFVYFLDFFTFDGLERKRFLEIPFHSFASYNQLKSVLSNLWMIHNWNTEKLSITEIKQEQKRLQVILDRHYRVKKFKGALTADQKEDKRKFKLGKEAKTAVDKGLERLQKILNAYRDTEYLGGKTLAWNMYDSALPPILNLLTKLKADTQWFEAPLLDYTPTHENEESLHRSTKYYSVVQVADIRARNDITMMAPVMECGIDIEVYGAEKKTTKKGVIQRQFPDPLHKDSVCFQIAVTPHRYGTPITDMKKILLTLGDPVHSPREDLPEDDPQRIVVHRCETERHMYLKLFEVLKEIDFDILYTYNGRNFDVYVIYQRCVLLGLVVEADRFGFGGKAPTKTSYNRIVKKGALNDTLSRSGVTNIQQKNSVFQTAAFGMAEYRDVLMPGRTHLDLLPYMRSNFKFQKNSLDYVAKYFLSEGKDEMSIEALHMAYENRDPQELMRTGEYCIQDTALLQALVSHKKTKIIENLIAMARVTFVPLDFIITRGQQIKVFSQLSRKAREQGKAIPHYIEDSEFTDNRLVGMLDEHGDLIEDDEEEIEEDEDDDDKEEQEDTTTAGDGKSLKRKTTAEEGQVQSPIKKKRKKGAKKYQGATVIEPKTGIYGSTGYEPPQQTLKRKRIDQDDRDDALIRESESKSEFTMDDIIQRPKELAEYLDAKERKRLLAESESLDEAKRKLEEEKKKKAHAVVTLDFASLYPSIIRAFNLDYSTIIQDPKSVEKFRKKGFEIDVYEWTDEQTGVEFYVGNVRKDPGGNAVPGTLPAMLAELMNLRKSVKKEAVMELDPERKAMLDAKQLAIKVSANSAYGFCAAQTLPCPTISALVCHIGRKALHDTAALAEKAFGCDIVYGDTDSVFLIFKQEDGSEYKMTDLFILAEKAAKYLTDEIFRKIDPNTPMNLEFEKIYYPLLMYGKKRYEGMEYTIDEYQTEMLRAQHPNATPEEREKLIVIGKPKYKSKGVVTSRRDTTKIAGDTYRAVIESILAGGSEEAAVEIVRDNISRIQNDMIQDYSMFSITQSVKDMDSYDNPRGQAAVVVAERMRERGIDIQPGATVSYVYLDDKDVQPLPESLHAAGGKQLKAHTAEDVTYAMEHKLKINRMNYIETIKNGLKPFFAIAAPETQKAIAAVYSKAKQLENYYKDKDSSGPRNGNQSSEIPWLDVPDGACPWGGNDEGATPLGSMSSLSKYLKGVVTKEVALFKKAALTRWKYGGNQKFALQYPNNCKQVHFGRAVLELKSNDPFCPVHRRVHARTEKDRNQILHRVHVTGSGIRFICRKEGNTDKWPPQFKDGSSATPLVTPKLKEIFHEVNNRLKKMELDYNQKHISPVVVLEQTPVVEQESSNDVTNEGLATDEPVPEFLPEDSKQPEETDKPTRSGCIDMGF